MSLRKNVHLTCNITGYDVVVLSIQGCASVVGLPEFVGKNLKLSTVDTTDKEGEDILVRKITTVQTSWNSTQL